MTIEFINAVTQKIHSQSFCFFRAGHFRFTAIRGQAFSRISTFIKCYLCKQRQQTIEIWNSQRWRVKMNEKFVRHIAFRILQVPLHVFHFATLGVRNARYLIAVNNALSLLVFLWQGSTYDGGTDVPKHVHVYWYKMLEKDCNIEWRLSITRNF